MADLVIWCVFSGFSYEDSRDCAGFLCCLAGIFGFLVGFLGDFIRNLQMYLCVVWLGFLLFFFFFLKEIFFCAFFCRDFFFFFLGRDFDTFFYGFRDFGIVTMLIFLVL